MDMHATDYRLLTKTTLFNAQQADALYKEFLYRQYTHVLHSGHIGHSTMGNTHKGNVHMNEQWNE